MSDYNRPNTLERELKELKRRLRGLESASRLAYSSIDVGSIKEYDVYGTLVGQYGEQFDGTHTAASLSGPVPPTPTVPVVTGAVGGINVRWDGSFLDSALTPMDFSRVEIYVSVNPDLTAIPAYLVGSVASPQGGEQFIAVPNDSTYYVILASRSQSGKVSEISNVAYGSAIAIDVGEIVPPKAPTGLVVTSNWVYDPKTNLPVTSFGISWSAVTQDTSDSAVDIVGYEVWTTSASDWTLLFSTVNTNISVEGLPFNTTHKFQVRALSQVPGGFSVTATGTYASSSVVETVPALNMSTVDVTSRFGTLNVKLDLKTSTNTDLPSYIQKAVVGAKETGSGGSYTAIGSLLNPNDPGTVQLTPDSLPTTYDVAVKLVTFFGTESSWTAYPSNPTIVQGLVDADLVSTTIDAQFDALDTEIDSVASTANGKNKVTYSTANPSGSGTAAGDIWFKRSAGIVTGQWEWTGSTWSPVALDNAVIANLDAGKITSGYIDAARINAGTITADKIAVGVIPQVNLLSDPSFEVASKWTFAGSGTQQSAAATARSGTYYLRHYVAGTSTATVTKIASPSARVAIDSLASMELGVWFKKNSAGQTGTLTLRANYSTTPTGTLSGAVTAVSLDLSTIPDTNWRYISGIAKTVVASYVYLDFSINVASISDSYLYLDDAFIGVARTGVVIANGQVTANMVAADAITSDKIAANAITASEIAAGAITTDKIAAGAITADMIDVTDLIAESVDVFALGDPYPGVSGAFYSSHVVINDEYGIKIDFGYTNPTTGTGAGGAAFVVSPEGSFGSFMELQVDGYFGIAPKASTWTPETGTPAELDDLQVTMIESSRLAKSYTYTQAMLMDFQRTYEPFISYPIFGEPDNARTHVVRVFKTEMPHQYLEQEELHLDQTLDGQYVALGMHNNGLESTILSTPSGPGSDWYEPSYGTDTGYNETSADDYLSTALVFAGLKQIDSGGIGNNEDYRSTASIRLDLWDVDTTRLVGGKRPVIGRQNLVIAGASNLAENGTQEARATISLKEGIASLSFSSEITLDAQTVFAGTNPALGKFHARAKDIDLTATSGTIDIVNTSGPVVVSGSAITLTGTVTASSTLRVNATGALTLSSTTHGFQIGANNATNLRMDRTGITAANNSAAGSLQLNSLGGSVELFKTNNAATDTYMWIHGGARNTYTTPGLLNIGTDADRYLMFDNDQIQAVTSGGVVGNLYINPGGGSIRVGGPIESYGGSEVVVNSYFRVATTGDVPAPGQTGIGGLMVGSVTGSNIQIDDNEIGSYINGVGASLLIQESGGSTSFGGELNSKGEFVVLARYRFQSDRIYSNSSLELNANSGTVGKRDIFLQNDSTSDYFLSKTVYNRTYSTGTYASVNITTTGVLHRNTSARKYKISIEDAPNTWSDAIDLLRPRTWHDKGTAEVYSDLLHKEEKGESVNWEDEHVGVLKRIPGFVAEEVEDAGLSEFVIYDEEGEVEGLSYQNMVAVVVAGIQSDRKKIAQQQEDIDTLKQQVADLLAAMA